MVTPETPTAKRDGKTTEGRDGEKETGTKKTVVEGVGKDGTN